MKQGDLFIKVFVGTSLLPASGLILNNWPEPKEPECKDVVYVPYSIRDSFQFCRETGLVFNPIDSIWVEPNFNEKRRIRKYFKED